MTRPDNLRLDDQLCFALYAATNSVTRAYRPLLAEIGLTYPQYLVMLVLWQDGDHSVNEIAGRLALPPHALSPMLDRLEKAGLLRRLRAGPDRRVVTVQLTQAGAELEVAAGRVQHEVFCATTFSRAENDALRAVLRALVTRMDERRDAAAAPEPGLADGGRLT